MSRNRARVVSLQALFQLDVDAARIPGLIVDRAEEEELTERDVEYVNTLVNNVVSRQGEIDDIIRKYSIDWDISRLGRVDKAILRIAICEISIVGDIPESVSINEAVRLAKKYGSENSSRFINGILGKFARDRGKQ